MAKELMFFILSLYFRALASIYEEPNWSKGDIDKTMESVKKELSKTILSLFSSEQLWQYKEKIDEREKQGHIVSLIDMWGLALEYLFRGKVKTAPNVCCQFWLNIKIWKI